ncbi:hypothetical protein HK105_203389 [Polyrhizophydium stewartii]|uniref:Uncharacterized protein n=1 Tax=Polyrhizophydium stewartii TaxID=2732419 RepID=A0ABR4NBQ4_9FUNG
MRVTSSRRSRRAGRSAARRAVSAILTRSQAKANPEKAKRMMKAVTDKAQAAEDKRRADRQQHQQQQEHQHQQQQDQHQQQQQDQQDHQSSPARFGQRHMLREAQEDSVSLMVAYASPPPQSQQQQHPQLVGGLAYMEVDGAPGPADLASHEKQAAPQKQATPHKTVALRKQKRVYKYREYPRDKGAAQNMQISGDAINDIAKSAGATIDLSEPDQSGRTRSSKRQRVNNNSDQLAPSSDLEDPGSSSKSSSVGTREQGFPFGFAAIPNGEGASRRLAEQPIFGPFKDLKLHSIPDFSPLKDALSQPLRAVHTLGHNDFLEYEKRLFAILQLIFNGFRTGNEHSCFIRTTLKFLGQLLRIKSPRFPINITIADVIVSSALYLLSIFYSCNRSPKHPCQSKDAWAPRHHTCLAHYFQKNFDAALEKANGDEDIIRTIKEIMKLSTCMHLDFANAHGMVDMMNHYVSIISKLPDGDFWNSSAAGIPSRASSQAAHAPPEAFKECYCTPPVGKRCRCKLDDEVLEDHPVPLTNEEANEQEKAVSEIAQTCLKDAWDAVNRTPVDDLQSCSDGKLRGVMLLAQKLGNKILDLCGIAEGRKEHCRAMRMLEAGLLLKYNDPKVQVKHALFSSLSGALGLTDCPNKDCFDDRAFEDILGRETKKKSFKIKSKDLHWLSHAVRSVCRIPSGPKADQGATYSGEERRAIRKAFKPKDSTLHAMMCRAGSACKYAGANSK